MWRESFQLGGIVLALSIVYSFFFYQDVSILPLSQAIGLAAALMIGFSYAMSGFGYYFDFLDAKVGFRKYYGLVGLLLAIIHAYTLFFVDPERYFFKFFFNLGSVDFVLGIMAMAILLGMVIISTPEGIKTIGAKNWRLGLRTGYVASALFVTRASLLYSNDWHYWLDHGDWYLPPPTLLATLFTIGVIVFRASIFVSQEFKKLRTTQSPPASPPTE